MKDKGVPGQPLKVGLTVMVVVMEVVPVFVPVKVGIFPEPDAGIPLVVLLFVQSKVVPATGLDKVMAGLLAPLHRVIFVIGFTMVVGLTVMVKVLTGPTHPAAVGVMLMVDVIGVVPGLVAVNDGIFPLPDVANPMAALLLVQVYVVPATLLPNAGTFTVLCGQTSILVMAVTLGKGLTVTCTWSVAVQLYLSVDVNVYVVVAVGDTGFACVEGPLFH